MNTLDVIKKTNTLMNLKGNANFVRRGAKHALVNSSARSAIWDSL